MGESILRLLSGERETVHGDVSSVLDELQAAEREGRFAAFDDIKSGRTIHVRAASVNIVEPVRRMKRENGSAHAPEAAVSSAVRASRWMSPPTTSP